MIQLDDAVSLAVNTEGDELLRLGFDIEGKICRVRFPTMNDYNDYVANCARFFGLLSEATGGNIEIPDDVLKELQDTERLTFFLAVMSKALVSNRLRTLCEEIFFNYLRPQIEGLEDRDARDYIMNNLGIDKICMLFVSIVLVNDWIKKKGIFIMTKVFQILELTASSNNSGKNKESLPINSGIPQSF